MWHRQLILLVLVTAVLTSCKVLNPSIMLRTGKDFQYDQNPDTAVKEYKLHANDRLTFRLLANDGFRLVDMQNGGETNGSNFSSQTNSITYLIEFDGQVKLPIIGRVYMEGLTIRQAEKLLEDAFKDYYKNPFVMLEVINKRVIVFPGSGGNAQVVTLINENTTLIEAVASAGGIPENGKAHRVKLIRGELTDPEVYLVDLSTIEGVKQADMVLQANDIIYVEPRLNFTTELLKEISPVISIVSSTVLVLVAIRSFTAQ